MIKQWDVVVLVIFAAMIPIVPNVVWASQHGSDARYLHEAHPLMDKIWSRDTGQFISQSELVEKIAKNTYVLLGETHDNRLHHQYQSWVIQQLHAKQQKRVVAFEMIDFRQQDGVERQASSLSTLLAYLESSGGSWGYTDLYADVFESAINAGFSIQAANIDRKQLIAIIMQGKRTAPVFVAEQLKRFPMTEPMRESMRQEVDESHCHLLPKEQFDAMVLGQRVRDAAMAVSLMQHQAADGAILIAGSGHVRRDRGVPAHIRANDSAAQIASVAWIEIIEAHTQPQQYAQQEWHLDQLPFDFVWFTPRLDRPDPCDQLKHHHKRPQSD